MTHHKTINKDEKLKELATALREDVNLKDLNFSQLTKEQQALIDNTLKFLNVKLSAYGVQLTAASLTLALQHINFEDLLRELAHIQSSDKINLHEFVSIFATSPNLRNFIELVLGSGNVLLKAGKAQNNPTAKRLAELIQPSRFLRGAGEQAKVIENNNRQTITVSNLAKRLYVELGNIISFNINNLPPELKC